MQLNEAVQQALNLDNGMVVLVGENYKAYRERSVAAYLAGNKVIYRIPPGMRAWANIDREACVRAIMGELKVT